MLTIILLSVCLVCLIVSLVTNILLYKALRNQLKRVRLYEGWIVEYEQWVQDVRNVVGATYLKMRKIDGKGWFFNDEDVGFVFSALLDLLKNLNDRIQK